uniref:Dna polymerase B n=1 Tax=Siphoviridae sp. ctYgF8 TaxID=2826378 RepID=A0A8S5NJD1_9CAUD|nr:MAG TPA: Dna polymerase B [Siphoviridae sp. ctYgF8]
MSIIRAKREHNYTVISNKVYDKNQLSWQAMGMLGYLLTKPDDWSVIVSELVNVTKETAKPTGKEGVYNILKELRDKGFIVVQKNSDGSTDYTVYDEPLPNQGKPNQGKPNQGKPNQGKPNQGKPNQAEPPLLNTDIQQVLSSNKDGDVEIAVADQADEDGEHINSGFASPDGLADLNEFPMADGWKPADETAFDAKLRRSQIPCLADSRVADALAEFSSYWQAAGKVLTQAMWEHKFFQLLARQKAQGVFASKPKDPSHRRLNQPQQGGNGAGDGQPNPKRGVLRPLGRMV